MKIKIIEPGYEGFTGMFGVVAFENAVSVDHVSSAEVNLIASIIKVVDAATGKETGNLATEMQSWDKTADVIYFPTMADINAGVTVAPRAAPVEQKQTVAKLYTSDELEAIADKKGIAGLREIADPLNVKGTGISKLIEDILAAQGTPAASSEE